MAPDDVVAVALQQLRRLGVGSRTTSNDPGHPGYLELTSPFVFQISIRFGECTKCVESRV